MAVRRRAGMEVQGPIDVWSLLEAHELTVRFTPLNVEGLYIPTTAPPLILIGSERPLPRRVFTAAHELGHHVFSHGSTVDEATQTGSEVTEELLVDLFAGYLLMPPLAVRRAFVQRGLDVATAAPLGVYAVASAFGVGYTTLIDHMALSLGFLAQARADTLKKTAPKNLRAQVLDETTSGHLVIVDEHWELPTIDVEVGDDIVLPAGSIVSGDNVQACPNADRMRVRATRPGIGQAFLESRACFVRVARKHYQGLLKYRHLEDPDFPGSQTNHDAD
jgi:hypothetical protein